MEVEKNLNTIAQLAKANLKSNKNFANLLKTQDTNTLDNIIHRLNDTITPKIDCLECGNCCHNLRPIATERAMAPFVEPENMEAYRYLYSFACKNLKGNACTVYSERPQECREYPYLHRPNFVDRTHELLQNYEICPIVYNVFEALKKELKWTSKPY